VRAAVTKVVSKGVLAALTRRTPVGGKDLGWVLASRTLLSSLGFAKNPPHLSAATSAVRKDGAPRAEAEVDIEITP